MGSRSASRVFIADPTLIRDVRRFGKFDVNGCYNCGSCTVSCDVSAELSPFPRRSIQYTLLGLREMLHESLEPWLCSDCGDCAKHCPREAEPRESLATLRRYLSSRYDWTGLSSKIYRSKTSAAVTMIGTGLMVLILIAFSHLFLLGVPVSDLMYYPAGFEHMFGAITYLTRAIIFFPVAILIFNGYRMYRFTMVVDRGESMPASLYLSELRTTILNALTQTQMRECPDSSRKVRWVKHVMVASGCALMLFLLAFFLRWFQTDNIYPFYHPQRWLGYIATATLIYVSVDILIGRIRREKELHEFSEVSDFTFPILLLLTALSGIAVHFLRYGGYELAAHYTYALHLAIATPLLVIELPFGKWSHVMYRPLALYLQSVREKAGEATLSEKDLEAA